MDRESDDDFVESVRRSPRLAATATPASLPASPPVRRSPRLTATTPPASPQPILSAALARLDTSIANSDALIGVRRSPRVRVKHPRLLMQQWLDSEPPGTFSMEAPSHPLSPGASVVSAGETVDTADNDSADNDSVESSSVACASAGRRIGSLRGAARLERLFDPDVSDALDTSKARQQHRRGPRRKASAQKKTLKVAPADSDDDSEYDADDADEDIEDEPDGGNDSDSIATTKKRQKRSRGTASGQRTHNDNDNSDHGGSGNFNLPHISDRPVAVPPLRDTFDGWDEFYQHFQEYCRATHQAIRKKHKLDVDARNEKIRSSKAAQAGLFVRYVPSIWVVLRRIFICTHGWRQRDRGTGKRPQRFLRSVACPFKFTVIVRYDEIDHVWRLKVESAHWFHNHVVNPEVFKTYAENRRVRDPSNRAKMENMIENKGKRRPIYNMLLAQGENVIMKDVENMIAAYNKEVKSEDDDAACLGKLAVFASGDGNWVSIDETAAMETGVINLSSGFMCQTVSRFFEILLFDSSHQTNRFNHQLFTIMAIDDYGGGQPVQHSLLERNADWHMSRVLEHFERVNQGIAEKIEVLMVDKDLNEIKILRKYFPRARVLICSFHVVKYLKTASRMPEYGKVSTDDHDAIDANTHNMVYARTEEEYESNRDMLRDVCAAVGYDAFYAYFEANWDSCIDMWVLYTRLRLPHLRVHTNNHLESFFGHFKDNIERSSTMTEAVDALIEDDRARANEYVHKKTKIGRYYNSNYDTDMNQLLRFTNPFVAESVEEEYKSAVDKRDVFVFEEKDGGVVGVRGHTKYHEFDKRNWLCSCSFCRTIKLPCQHVIAYRKMKDAEMSIPLQAVHERWLGPVSANSTPSGSRLKFAPFHDPTKKRKWTSAEKYREAVRATEAVCSELATISDDEEFREHLEFLLDGWRNVRQRKRVKVSVEPDVEAEPSQATQPQGISQLSQPHSLYSEELGDVPLVAYELPAAEGELIAEDPAS